MLHLISHLNKYDLNHVSPLTDASTEIGGPMILAAVSLVSKSLNWYSTCESFAYSIGADLSFCR